MKVISKPVFNAVQNLYRLNNSKLKLDVNKILGFTSDTFISTSKLVKNLTPVKLKLYSYSDSMNYLANLNMDLSVAQKIILEKETNVKKFSTLRDKISVYYNPNINGQVFERVFNKITKKVEKKPFDVNILQSYDGIWETTYYFMKKDLSECVGYVTLGDWQKWAKNYGVQPENGITVTFLQNFNDKKYAGIGKLADRLEIEYCLKNNIKPLIISEADPGSHIAHYKRGKRFFPLTEDDDTKKFFVDRYGSSNINAVISKLLSENKDNKINISDWPPVNMYLSRKAVVNHIKSIKEKPIL